MTKIESRKKYTEIYRDGLRYKIICAETKSELLILKFQEDRTRNAGVNGIHSEDLVIILADRIKQLQQSGFKCAAHEDILDLLDEIKMLLDQRPKR